MMTISELVRLLRGLTTSQLEAQHVEGLLKGAVLDRSTLSPYLFRRMGCYTRNLVFRNTQFEMLALVWDAGACSAIHDHAGQECFFSVQQGAFQQEDFLVVEADGKTPGPFALKGLPLRGTLTPGNVDHRSPDSALHRIINVGETRGVSLHVYSRPIDQCLIYDRTGWSQPRVMRYDSVEGRPQSDGLSPMSPLCSGVPLVSH